MKSGTGLSGGELSTLMWFVLSGTIHVVFEGYYVRFYEELAGKEGVLGEMWKEYAFSDSRWVFFFASFGGLILVSVFEGRRRRRHKKKERAHVHQRHQSKKILTNQTDISPKTPLSSASKP